MHFLKTPKDCELGDRVMCVQLHGDASFTGQGVVMESFGLSEYTNSNEFGVWFNFLMHLPISFYRNR